MEQQRFNEIRQEEVKNRRVEKMEADFNHRNLMLNRWPLIKYVRSQMLGKKFDELEEQRLMRTWCIFAATYDRVFSKIF